MEKNNMKIAVVDVAAESGGALSVLLDFIHYIESDYDFCSNNQWVVYTSRYIHITKDNIELVVIEKIKKSWFHRIFWEKYEASKDFKNRGINIVFSLQNTAFKKGNYKQLVFFHNVLLLEPRKKYSLFKPEERRYAIYTHFIAPYTIKSLRNAHSIIVQTEAVKTALLSFIPTATIQVIHPNVVFDEKYKNTSKLPIKGLIYPTSAAPFKRIEEIIECVDKYSNWFLENKFEILLTINGNENMYAERIYSLAHNLLDIVKFIGFQVKEELFELYKEYGLLICSELESFSLPFIEAGFVGTPIVAARYPYSIERSCGLNNVFLYNSSNSDQLFEAIIKSSQIRSNCFNNISYTNNTWDDINWKV